ncbi:hypothetical protein GCM10027408_00300 [Microbacterium tumbae]
MLWTGAESTKPPTASRECQRAVVMVAPSEQMTADAESDPSMPRPLGRRTVLCDTERQRPCMRRITAADPAHRTGETN